MTWTAEGLAALGLSEEQTRAVMQAGEEDARRLAQAEQALEEAKSQAALAEKRALYREALRSAGVDERRAALILRVSDLSGLAVKDGRLADAQAVDARIREEWGDFIPRETVTGTPVANPPVRAPGGMTREAILAIRDAGRRQRAIAEHIDQFLG